MRKLLVLSTTIALSACTTTSPNNVENPAMCNADNVQSFIGQTYTVEVGADLQNKTGARTMRVVKPGQPVTMDLRQDRLNVGISDNNVIEIINCG